MEVSREVMTLGFFKENVITYCDRLGDQEECLVEKCAQNNATLEKLARTTNIHPEIVTVQILWGLKKQSKYHS